MGVENMSDLTRYQYLLYRDFLTIDFISQFYHGSLNTHFNFSICGNSPLKVLFVANKLEQPSHLSTSLEDLVAIEKQMFRCTLQEPSNVGQVPCSTTQEV